MENLAHVLQELNLRCKVRFLGSLGKFRVTLHTEADRVGDQRLVAEAYDDSLEIAVASAIMQARGAR